MITCPKCNKVLSDGAKFCSACGAPVFETIYCPNCGKQTSTEFAFCQSCGASLTETPAEEPPVAAPAKKKKRLPKAVVFGGIGVAAIALLVFVISLLSSGSGGKAESDYVFYVKDKEIYAADLRKDSEAWQLTTHLVDSNGVENEDIADSPRRLSWATYVSEDGRYIFFPDKMEYDVNVYGYDLYYKEVAKPDAEAVKIDSEVDYYVVNPSATIVTYSNNDGSGIRSDLYQYKISDDSKVKIASGIGGFDVSDDGKKIVYYDFEGSLYLKCADKEAEKIASDVWQNYRVTSDFSTVYYRSGRGVLYKQVEGADKVKIADADDVSVIEIYDSGEIYYVTREIKALPIKDYVTDDMKDADASITEPDLPDYPDAPSRPSRGNYNTYAEYDAAYAAYEDDYKAWGAEVSRLRLEYSVASDKWYGKQIRDELREALKEETMVRVICSLCYYNGTEEVVITDALSTSSDAFSKSASNCASETPVIIYPAYNQSSFEKVKLSEVKSISDIKDMVEAAFASSSETYVAVRATATVIEQGKENFMLFEINSTGTGTEIYCANDVPDGKMYGDLYCISITDGVIGEAEVYDSDVYYDSIFLGSDVVEYFKNFKNGKGELYINKNRVDYDVCFAYGGPAKVLYFTDLDDNKEYRTLKVYDGKESIKISDNVSYYYDVTPDGRVLYLYDYSSNDHKGELYEWFNGETRKIDDDVVCFYIHNDE